MEMIIRVLLTIVIVTFSQEIIFNSLTLITPCTSKSRADKDRLVITGTVGENVSSLVAQDWVITQRFNVWIAKIRNYNIIGATSFQGNYCFTVPSYLGSCVVLFDVIHFVLNYTLKLHDSQGYVYAVWYHTNTKRFVRSNKNYTLPVICDVNTARLTLTVAGVVVPVPATGACNFTLTLNTSNPMQLCCSDMAMPCYTQISFRGTVVANNESPCVTYSPTLDGVTGTVQLSYSVCTQSEYIPGNNCKVQPGVVITTATETTATVPPTVPPRPQKSNTLQIILGAVSIVIALIICLLLARWIIRRRRRQTVDTSSTWEDSSAT